jgi:predicted PurR-regulated permease PerM
LADAIKQSKALIALALLAGLAACWYAQAFLVPITLAMFLALVANPMVSGLRRLWIPRGLGAAVVVLGALASTTLLGGLLVGPATNWVQKAPTELRQLAPKIKGLVGQVDQANRAAASIASAAGAGPAPGATRIEASGRPQTPNLWGLVLGMPRVLASILAISLLAYFFLIYGYRLQRQALDMLADVPRQERGADILRSIAQEVAGYVITISVINAVLGALVAGALFWQGLDLADALLWGMISGVLNYIPYIGPAIGVLSLAVVGVVAFDTPGAMLLPAAVYLGLQLLESEFLKPIIIGRRMALSPLVMLLWLMLWTFLWGIAGALLAVPMLMTFKVVADRIEPWRGWARLIE